MSALLGSQRAAGAGAGASAAVLFVALVASASPAAHAEPATPEAATPAAAAAAATAAEAPAPGAAFERGKLETMADNPAYAKLQVPLPDAYRATRYARIKRVVMQGVSSYPSGDLAGTEPTRQALWVRVPRAGLPFGDLQIEVVLVDGNSKDIATVTLEAVHPAPVLKLPEKKTIIEQLLWFDNDVAALAISETGGAAGVVAAEVTWSGATRASGRVPSGAVQCSKGSKARIDPRGAEVEVPCTASGFGYGDVGTVHGSLRVMEGERALGSVPVEVHVKVGGWVVFALIALGIYVSWLLRQVIEPRRLLVGARGDARRQAERAREVSDAIQDRDYHDDVDPRFARFEASIARAVTEDEAKNAWTRLEGELKAAEAALVAREQAARTGLEAVTTLLSTTLRLPPAVAAALGAIRATVTGCADELRARNAAGAHARLARSADAMRAASDGALAWLSGAKGVLTASTDVKWLETAALAAAVTAKLDATAATTASATAEAAALVRQLQVVDDVHAHLAVHLGPALKKAQDATAKLVGMTGLLAVEWQALFNAINAAHDVDAQLEALGDLTTMAQEATRVLLENIRDPALRPQIESSLRAGDLDTVVGARAALLGGAQGPGPPPTVDHVTTNELARVAVAFAPPPSTSPALDSVTAAAAAAAADAQESRRLGIAAWLLIGVPTAFFGTALLLDDFIGTPQDLLAAFSWGLTATITVDAMNALANAAKTITKK